MRRFIFIGILCLAAAVAPQFLIESALYARIVSVAAVCLVLWLTETGPPFVPTLLLWLLIPLAIGPLDSELRLSVVLGWAADPVLALFFGGFVLGVAAERYGIDRQLISFAVRASGNSFNILLLLVIFLTAFLSMWLSNIAAAALMIACLRPAFTGVEADDVFRRTLLIGVALGADLGGMATPIGTGPNAVAIAALEGTHHVSFIGWMIFAFPLTLGMLIFGYVLLRFRAGTIDSGWSDGAAIASLSGDDATQSDSQTQRRMLILIMIATIILWLSEPLHGISAALVSIGASVVLFLSGILGKASLAKVDWSTLILISGGITLGKLLESSGIIKALSASVPFDSFSPTLALFVVCLFTALLASVMSNTASSIMLIPLATALISTPSTAILVAISASFGIPFVISTPQNAMVYGEGGLRTGDIFWPGITIMIVGCVLVSTTGPSVLRFVGIP